MPHGYLLYNQLLRLWALRCAAAAFADDFYAPQTARLPGECKMDYLLLGFNPSQVYTTFGLQANALALLLNIGTPAQQDAAVTLITEFVFRQRQLVPSLSPRVAAGSCAMSELQNNYTFWFRNTRHRFHNGGLWPV